MKLPSEDAIRTSAAKHGMKRIFRAPGRVNLIGEHTDYNGGYVLPVAIDLYCTVEVVPSGNGRLTVRSLDLGEDHSWAIGEIGEAKPVHGWSDYAGGVAVELRRRGVPICPGLLEISSTVPIGAGLSSSAALEIAVGLALATVAGSSLDRRELAAAALAAEQEFVGTRCGIMDQLIAVAGLKDHALLIDCRSLELRPVRLPADLELVMVNTMLPHQLSSSQYNTRRAECEQATSLLGKPLRDICERDWPATAQKLPERLMRRARHIVTENARVLEFVRACEQNDVAQLGRLMAASHESLASDYEVSCPELDFLVELAAKLNGVAGARMTGGGFGGCTVNLVSRAAFDSFRQTITAGYERRFGIRPTIYRARSADGASEITPH